MAKNLHHRQRAREREPFGRKSSSPQPFDCAPLQFGPQGHQPSDFATFDLEPLDHQPFDCARSSPGPFGHEPTCREPLGHLSHRIGRSSGPGLQHPKELHS